LSRRTKHPTPPPAGRRKSIRIAVNEVAHSQSLLA
jgi:hypothetical protein